jgi:hypothetical protein
MGGGRPIVPGARPSAASGGATVLKPAAVAAAADKKGDSKKVEQKRAVTEKKPVDTAPILTGPVPQPEVTLLLCLCSIPEGGGRVWGLLAKVVRS